MIVSNLNRKSGEMEDISAINGCYSVHTHTHRQKDRLTCADRQNKETDGQTDKRADRQRQPNKHIHTLRLMKIFTEFSC